eukprot:CAMPEP_0115170632 /NCGR_PEP_ID=MMETSP0270-20121206/1887_1 /TAXON_ID=71861 /ORGANISM="Scrippsiella trochoidea, Strain CCMP3099" /LENGTH=497 /DNA_ID=CAMNT_0002583373 /DNA_START=113 /DNA_END=1606 /DNA_ORIENTATION=+
MDGQLRHRALGASVGSASIVGGVVAIVAGCLSDRSRLLSLVIGTLVLGPAQLLRAAAVLRRGPSCRSKSRIASWVRCMLVAFLSVAMTTVAVAVFLAGFDGADDDAWYFGGFLGFVALIRLWRQGVLEWTTMPREAAHRRVKSRLCGIVFEATFYSVVCVLLAAWSQGSLYIVALRARLMAGILVFFAGEAHAEALQDCTSLPTTGEMPRGFELAEALVQPLVIGQRGPGLGRWFALTMLAQAASHRQQGALCRTRAGNSKPMVGSRRGSLPPLAAEVFGLVRSSPYARLPCTSGSGFSTSMDGHQASAMSMQHGDPRGKSIGFEGLPSTSTAASGSLFSTYLASGLEVLREFTIRVQCLAAAPRLRGPDALRPVQLAELDAAVAEMLPLLRVAATGLSGWICLSRDFDEAGVVQREEALQQVIYELCGVLASLEGLRPLLICGALQPSTACAVAVQEAQGEATHSLEQLLLTFEHAGLRQISLPRRYKRFIMDLGS